MDLLIHFLLLTLGLFFLLKGGDLLIVGAEKISLRYGVSPMIIGLTVVAFGTSLPEFFVSFMANINGNQGIGLGNVVGSNIANIGLVLGTAAMIGYITIDKSCLKRDLPFVIIISILAYYMMFADVGQFTTGIVSRFDGIFLVILFILYIGYIFYKAKIDKEDLLEDEIDLSTKLWQDYAYITLGIIGLYFGSKFTIDNGSAIAKAFGVSDLVIGLTVVAIGTSLPELVATVQAVRKNNHDIGVGNIVGSNIFNILFVLGINSIVKPFPVEKNNIIFWGPIMIAFALILYPLAGKKRILNKYSGMILLSLYFIYMALTFILKNNQ